jgi:GAF domain
LQEGLARGPRPPRKLGRVRSLRGHIMATQGPVIAVDIAAFSAQLLDYRETPPRARIIVEAVTDLLPGTAAIAYLLATLDDGQVWAPQATAGDVHVNDSAVNADRGTLGMMAEKSEPVVLSGRDLVREQYAHLNVRRTLNSLAYLPLKTKRGELFGAIEILSFDFPLGENTLSALQPLADVAGSALADAVSYEQERNSALSSITRITQLYDLEKVFGSTLELDQLLPIIGSKFREVLECRRCPNR